MDPSSPSTPEPMEHSSDFLDFFPRSPLSPSPPPRLQTPEPRSPSPMGLDTTPGKQDPMETTPVKPVPVTTPVTPVKKRKTLQSVVTIAPKRLWDPLPCKPMLDARKKIPRRKRVPSKERVVQEQLPEPIPKRKEQLPEPIPKRKEQLPEPIPKHKEQLPEPIPKRKEQLPEPIPKRKEQLPEPIPKRKEQLPEPIPKRKEQLPEPLPKRKKALPEPLPVPRETLPVPKKTVPRETLPVPKKTVPKDVPRETLPVPKDVPRETLPVPTKTVPKDVPRETLPKPQLLEPFDVPHIPVSTVYVPHTGSEGTRVYRHHQCMATLCIQPQKGYTLTNGIKSFSYDYGLFEQKLLEDLTHLKVGHLFTTDEVSHAQWKKLQDRLDAYHPHKMLKAIRLDIKKNVQKCVYCSTMCHRWVSVMGGMVHLLKVALDPIPHDLPVS